MAIQQQLALPAGRPHLGGLLLKLFLILIFFVYYQTRLVPGTLHSWVLVLGLLVTIPAIAKQCVDSGYSLPIDYAIIGLLVLLIVTGFVVNYGDTTVSQMQAYLLALAGYVFVRHNMPGVEFSFFMSLLTWFLLINSGLIIAQFLTGDFFPARYLAVGDPPLILPTGVSDGPTKNGMLQAFALSAAFARFVWLRTGRLYGQALLLLVGTVALLLSTSRAGIVAFLGAALVCMALFAMRRQNVVVSRRRSSFKQYVFLIVLVGLFVRALTLLPRLVNFQDYNYVATVIALKLNQRADDSILERFGTTNAALTRTLNNPTQLFAVGAGVGSFEKANEGTNLHNSYLELLFEVGALGFAAFLFLIGHVIRRALSRVDPAIVLPVLSGLLAIMVFMTFHDILRGRIFWTPLAILASFAYSRPRTIRVEDLAVPAGV